MDVKSTTNKIIQEGDLEGRKVWLKCLREFLWELENIDNQQVKDLIKKYNIYFVEVDELPRVNLDFPE